MESKNLKPRILDALDVIGRPATAREIAAVGAIDERIHPRLKEMEAAGDLIRLQEVGQPIRYALPTMDYEEQPPIKIDEMMQPQPQVLPTTATPENTRFSDIHLTLYAQKEAIDNAITAYVARVLDDDPIYSAMSKARLRLLEAMEEMSLRGLV